MSVTPYRYLQVVYSFETSHLLQCNKNIKKTNESDLDYEDNNDDDVTLKDESFTWKAEKLNCS